VTVSRPSNQGVRASLAVLLVSFGVLYAHVIAKLVHDWWTNENYSHGFLIVPLAAYFAWERRRALIDTEAAPSASGLLIVVLSLGVLLAGVLGAELFLTRLSLLGVIAGTVVFTLGWRHLKILAFPIGFLLLMIPVPAIIFNQIAFPLQLLASKWGAAALSALQIPVLREGNVIILANTTLEVAEACSGIRSLVSLLTLAIVFGYFVEPRAWARVTLALASIPVAIMVNGFRVAGTGIAAHYFGPAAAQGFLHEFAGLFMFAAAFAVLFALQYLIALVKPRRPRTGAAPMPEAIV
jgi:exosortase